MNLRILVLALFSLFLSTRGVAQWDSTNIGYSYAPQVYVAGNVLFAAGSLPGNAEDAGILWRSSNNGDSWQLDTGAGAPLFNAFAVIGSSIFLGTEQSWFVDSVISPGGLLRSTDGGLTWQQRNATIPDTTELDVFALAVDGNTLLRGSVDQTWGDTNAGIFASDDLGASWRQVIGGYNVYALIASGANVVASLQHLQVGNFPERTQTLSSSDQGSHWQRVHGIPDTDFFHVFGSVGGNLVGGEGSHGIYVSSDNGVNWIPATGAGLDTTYVTAFATVGSTIFATTNLGLYRSTDKGLTWNAMNEGLGSYQYFSGIAANSTYLFVARADGSVWRRPLSDFDGVNQPSVAGFAAPTNYPNPFDRSTTISFSLDKPCDVTLRVFNSLGESVARPITESFGAGTHQIEVPGSGLPNGSYMYRLSAGSHSQSGMMLVEHTGQ